MTQEQKDAAWRSLPEEAKEKVREVFHRHKGCNSSTGNDYCCGYIGALIDFFGKHNLTVTEVQKPRETDIEKKARESVHKDFFNANRSFIGNNGPLVAEAIEAGFDAGVTYALGNQWHDAEKEKPEYGETVLVRTDDSKYPTLAEWYGDYWEQEAGDIAVRSDDEFNPFKVLAWMEIPEYEPKGE